MAAAVKRRLQILAGDDANGGEARARGAAAS
jgi:hypothetical protein